MRIIHLSYNLPKPNYTDPETWLKRINFSVGVMESMTKYAEIMALYHIRYKGVYMRNDVSYHFTGYRRWQLLLPFQFNRYIKKLNPDVAIVHGLVSPWQVIMLRFQIGKHLKIVVQHHAERPLKSIRQYLQQWADRYISVYLFASADLGRLWVEQGQIMNPSKIKEIMEASSSFIPIEKENARRVVNVKGRRVFLWVGRLDVNKDPLVVVRAFVKFSRNNDDVRLYMIYQTFELLEKLKSLVSETDSMERIQLVGKVDNPNLQYWYNSADFIISSSHYEGSGIAVCEAMSCGCIPILTNIPSFRMMTDGGRMGLLYEPGSEAGLLHALQNSLDLDCESEKNRVLQQFREELSFDAIASKTYKLFSE